MRIQRQSESFSWRITARLHPEEWAAHQQHVWNSLNELARQGKELGLTDENSGQFDSRRLFGRVNSNGRYEPTDADRKMQSDHIRRALWEGGGPENQRGAETFPQGFSSLLMAGIGGSGKGSILGHSMFGQALGHGSHFILNPDDTKLMMAKMGMIPTEDDLRRWGMNIPGWDQLSPMEKSPFLHEEASDLTKDLAARLHKGGYNVIHDGTLGRAGKVDKLTADLRRRGYTPENGGRINAALVDVPMQEGLKRASQRHRDGHEGFLAAGGGMNIPMSGVMDLSDPNTFASLSAKNDDSHGGRALPPDIHDENRPPPGSLDPTGKPANSAPAANFGYVQSKTDSSIMFDGMYPKGGTPNVIGGHGPDFKHLIPANRMSYPQRMARIVTASENGPTASEIVDSYIDQRIDMDEMIHALAQRLHDTANDPPEEYDRNEHIPDPDDVIHVLRVAEWSKEISEEEYEHVMSALRPILFDE